MHSTSSVTKSQPLLTTTTTKLFPTFSPTPDINENNDCQYYPPIYLKERFWLVSVVGTSVAVISVFENLFLFFILTRK